jgi:hypothetical protein
MSLSLEYLSAAAIPSLVKFVWYDLLAIYPLYSIYFLLKLLKLIPSLNRLGQ